MGDFPYAGGDMACGTRQRRDSLIAVNESLLLCLKER